MKFRDTSNPYPDDKIILGRYLGPAHDVGPAMTARILKKNGRVAHTLTYRHLTQDEILDEGEKAEREEFTRTVNGKIGSPLTAKDSDEINQEAVTPKFELYSDDVETNSCVRDIDDVTSEEMDQ